MKAWPRNSRLACATKAPVVFARWPGAAHRVPGDHVVGDVGDDGPRFGHPAQQVGHVRADLTHRAGGRTAPPASSSHGTESLCRGKSPPPVFIGFGSMTPAGADRLSDLAATAGRQAGVRMVIQAGRAGLAQAGQSPGDSIVIGEVPHDWLFPKMAALIHHAGAGTAAAGLRAGVPAVTVPSHWATVASMNSSAPIRMRARALLAAAEQAFRDGDRTGASAHDDCQPRRPESPSRWIRRRIMSC